jgi:hypothetical protein
MRSTQERDMLLMTLLDCGSLDLNEFFELQKHFDVTITHKDIEEIGQFYADNRISLWMLIEKIYDNAIEKVCRKFNKKIGEAIIAKDCSGHTSRLTINGCGIYNVEDLEKAAIKYF